MQLYKRLIRQLRSFERRFFRSFVRKLKRADLESLQDKGGFESSCYWEERYRSGGTSGDGSYHELAAYKAQVINQFVQEKMVASVIDFGAGDGNQLSLFKFPQYRGLDVSATAISNLEKRFSEDVSKRFDLYKPGAFPSFDEPCGDLALSLDVVYHLTEDAVYDQYLLDLFSSAKRFVIVYSSDKATTGTAVHVRDRCFTPDVKERFPDWRLERSEQNPFSHRSRARFFFFARRADGSMMRDRQGKKS